MKNEIILYRPQQAAEHLEVRLDGGTVWLNQEQMSTLFNRSQSVISRYIQKVFEEGELIKKSNMHFLHNAISDKPVAYYSLNVIISVGYKVKSIQGTEFRIWATQILQDYLLKGYAVQNRLLHLENKVDAIQGKVSQIELKIQAQDLPRQGVFFEGQVFDAYELEVFSKSHDRFLILDQTEIYHLGASLKDLGKKWFAFSKIEHHALQTLLTAVKEVK